LFKAPHELHVAWSTPDGSENGKPEPLYAPAGSVVLMRETPDSDGRKMVEILFDDSGAYKPQLHEVRRKHPLLGRFSDLVYNPLLKEGGDIGPQEPHEEPQTPPDPEAAAGAKEPAKLKETDNVFVLNLIRGEPKRDLFGRLRENGPGVPRRTA
jgi:hypothetical protein